MPVGNNMALSFQDKIKPVATSSLSFQDKIKPVAKSKLGEVKVQEEKGIISKFASAVGNFFLGGLKGIGSTIEGLDVLTRKIPGLKQVQETFNPRTQEDIELAKKLTTAEGAAQKAGKFTEQVGEFLAPAGLIGKLGKSAEAILKGTKLGERAIKLGTLGVRAGLEGVSAGGVTAAQTGGNLEEAKKVGIVGAGLPVLGKILSPIGKAITEALPIRLMQSAIGQSKKALIAGKDISEFALKSKKVGTAEKLINDASNAVEELGKKIQNNLQFVTPKTARILKNEPISEVVNAINKAGGSITAKEVSGIIEQLAPQAKGLLQKQSLSLPEANQLRQLLDRTLGDRAFVSQQLTFNKDILKAYSGALRENVKKLAPKGTREIFSDLSKEITLRNALIDKYAGQARNQVLNAFDLILAGGGFLGGGAPGSISAVAAKKIIQSVAGKTISAQALKTAGDIAEKLKVFNPVEKAAILKFIQKDEND